MVSIFLDSKLHTINFFFKIDQRDEPKHDFSISTMEDILFEEKVISKYDCCCNKADISLL